MAELFGTTEVGGTSPGQIIYGMLMLGFSCRKVNVEPNPEELKAIGHAINSGAVAHMRDYEGKAEIWGLLQRRGFWGKEGLRNTKAIEFRK